MTSVAANVSYRRGPSKNSQSANGWVDGGTSTIGQGDGEDDYRHHEDGVEAALAQGIASSLRTLVIASFRAPPNKFVLGEPSKEGKYKGTLDDIFPREYGTNTGSLSTPHEPSAAQLWSGENGK